MRVSQRVIYIKGGREVCRRYSDCRVGDKYAEYERGKREIKAAGYTGMEYLTKIQNLAERLGV